MTAPEPHDLAVEGRIPSLPGTPTAPVSGQISKGWSGHSCLLTFINPGPYNPFSKHARDSPPSSPWEKRRRFLQDHLSRADRNVRPTFRHATTPFQITSSKSSWTAVIGPEILPLRFARNDGDRASRLSRRGQDGLTPANANRTCFRTDIERVERTFLSAHVHKPRTSQSIIRTHRDSPPSSPWEKRRRNRQEHLSRADRNVRPTFRRASSLVQDRRFRIITYPTLNLLLTGRQERRRQSLAIVPSRAGCPRSREPQPQRSQVGFYTGER